MQVMSRQDGLRLYLQYEDGDLSSNGVPALSDEQKAKIKGAVREALASR